MNTEALMKIADLVENDGERFDFNMRFCILPRTVKVLGYSNHHWMGSDELSAALGISEEARCALFFEWPDEMVHNPDRGRAARVIRNLAENGVVDWNV